REPPVLGFTHLANTGAQTVQRPGERLHLLTAEQECACPIDVGALAGIRHRGLRQGSRLRGLYRCAALEESDQAGGHVEPPAPPPLALAACEAVLLDPRKGGFDRVRSGPTVQERVNGFAEVGQTPLIARRQDRTRRDERIGP